MSIAARFVPLEHPIPAPPRGHRRSTFKGGFTNTLDTLEREIAHLKGEDIIIEADIPREDIRNDGWPRSSAKARSPGVAVSFHSPALGHLRYPCATFQTWEDNLRAIALGLAALRSVERYGIAARNEQYKGWSALPEAVTAGEWTNVEGAAIFLLTEAGHSTDPFNVRMVIASTLTLRDVYRAAAKKSHPDAGGSEERMNRVNRAKEMIEKEKNA